MTRSQNVVLAFGDAPSLFAKKLIEIEVEDLVGPDGLANLAKTAATALCLHVDDCCFFNADGQKIDTVMGLQRTLETAGGEDPVLEVRGKANEERKPSLTARLVAAEGRVDSLEKLVLELARSSGVGARRHEMRELEASLLESVDVKLRSVDDKLREVKAMNAVANVTTMHKALESQVLEKVDTKLRSLKGNRALAEQMEKIQIDHELAQSSLRTLGTEVAELRRESPTDASVTGDGLACALGQLDQLCRQLTEKLEESSQMEADLRQQISDVNRRAQGAEESVSTVLAELRQSRDVVSTQQLQDPLVDLGKSYWTDNCSLTGATYSSKTQRNLSNMQFSSPTVPFVPRGPSARGFDRTPSCPALLPPLSLAR